MGVTLVHVVDMSLALDAGVPAAGPVRVLVLVNVIIVGVSQLLLAVLDGVGDDVRHMLIGQ